MNASDWHPADKSSRLLPRQIVPGDAIPAEVLRNMAGLFGALADETVELSASAGRVLAQDVAADRDHPGCDVSAVDGYCLRLGQITSPRAAIVADARIGQLLPEIPRSGVVKIVTGAPVPPNFDAIIRREEVEEYADHIILPTGRLPQAGQDIRRRGDNVLVGGHVLSAGQPITPASMAALASFGICRPRVYRRVSVAIVLSGDELLRIDSIPQPWQIRESNGWVLQSLLTALPWVRWSGVRIAGDELSQVVAALDQSLQEADVVLLSGGVSMGDRDYVPDALEQVGARTIFRGLPIRPGKPMLGAIGARGHAVLALPGNPMSVLVTARRFASIVLRKLAGFSAIDPPVPVVRLSRTDVVHPKLWMYRPILLESNGIGRLLKIKNSGDMVTAAQSDGFVEIMPSNEEPLKAPFYRWGLQ